MKKPSARQLDLAERLIAHEQHAAGGATDVGVASLRVQARLLERLTTLMGRGGGRALFARSVRIVAIDHAFLRAVDFGGTRAEEMQETLTGAFEGQTPEIVSRSAVAILATMLGLLEMLIGEPLTSKVLRSGWPDFAVGSGYEEKEKS